MWGSGFVSCTKKINKNIGLQEMFFLLAACFVDGRFSTFTHDQHINTLWTTYNILLNRVSFKTDCIWGLGLRMQTFEQIVLPSLLANYYDQVDLRNNTLKTTIIILSYLHYLLYMCIYIYISSFSIICIAYHHAYFLSKGNKVLF